MRLERSAEERQRELPEGIHPLLLALPASVHFWDRVQRRREEGGTGTLLHSSVSRLAPLRQTHGDTQGDKETRITAETGPGQTGRLGTAQIDTQTDGRTDRQVVMASADSGGATLSARLTSGDLLHAGLTVALLLGELLPALPSLSASHRITTPVMM